MRLMVAWHWFTVLEAQIMKIRTSLRFWVAACLVAVSATATHAQTTLFWSSNNSTQGGSGTWTDASGFWGSVATGPWGSNWTNSNNDTARFGGTVGTVTLGGNVSVGGLWFDTTGYTIANGANTLSFGAANNAITLNNIAAATITGNVSGSGNVTLSTTNPATAGTLTLNGTSTSGWNGTTTINPGITLALSQSNQGLLNTSGITLNGGGITLISGNSTEGALNRVSNNATITSNGGAITYTNTSGTTQTYAETIGTVTLNRGQLNVFEANNMGAGNIQTLTLSGLSRSNTATSVVAFGSASGLGATNLIKVGSGGNVSNANTTAGQIIGPWALYGTNAGSITDYAIFTNGDGTVALAGTSLTAPGESGWGNSTTAYRATSTAEVLTATRTAAALRYTPGVGSISLGASNFNLETYSVLNGGSGTLTISTTGTGGLTTPTGGGNLYLTTGAAAITVSAPIRDNGGAVTLVKSGSSPLTLSNINNSYSGGTVLNAGAIAFGTNSDVYLGPTSGGLTFNGGQITYSDDFALNRNVTVNANMALTNRIVVNGVLSGDGPITQSGSDGATFANTGNTFTGSISVGYAMTFASLGDSSNSINIGGVADWTWTGGAKTFALRPFTMHAAGTAPITSSGTGALTIQQDIAISGAAGARTLRLGGTYTGGANTFAGNITDGPGSVVSFAKGGDNSIWALSGTNTYTGATTLSTGGEFGLLIFRGMQSLPSSTSLNQAQGGSNQRWGTIRILDDSATPASRSGVNLNWSIQENISPTTDPNRYFMRVFVGNNNTANGGTSSSTQAGRTIQLGNLNLTEGATTATGSGLWVTGANGYKLQIADVNVTLQGTTSNNFNATLRADAPLTVTGTVRQANDAAVGSTTTLQLDGSAAGSLVSGNITDSAGGRLMLLSKAGIGSWTLNGTNTYTGGTTITTGTLRFDGANSLPTTGTVAVGANGVLSLADGTARNQTVSALTLTSLGSFSFDWTGSGTGDQLTSTADVTPTAGSRFAVNLARSGSPGGSVTLLTGGASSTLSSSTFYLTNLTDYTATLTTTATTVSVGSYTSQTPLTNIYWRGNALAAAAVAGIDNAWALSNGTVSNWSSTTTAYTATALTPGSTANVIFANGQVGKTQQSTVLGADVTVNSVTIDDSTAVTIAGANGAALTLLSTSGTAGTVASPGSAISVTSNANATSTISSQVVLGANQTWNVASGKTLAVSGIVSGNYSLTKADLGTLTISAQPMYTGSTTINAGSLTLTAGATGGLPLLGSSSAVTLSQGATLNLNPSTTGINNIYTVGMPITLSGGAGTANIRVAGNDVRVYIGGNVTGQSGVAQTLAITQGAAVSSGDRQNILFSGVIANGGSGGTLGVGVNFAGSSGVAQNAFVNLSGQNTFTGDLAVTNTRGLNGPNGYTNQGAWLTIGGERYSPNAPIIAYMGNGYLGGGNYSGNISVSNGAGRTTLSYFSTANQILGGIISGNGSIQMDGTGTLNFSGSNTYTGSTTINSGTLAVTNIDVVANPNALGQSSAAASSLILRGGTLRYTTGGAASTDRNFALVSSSTLDASGAGALDFAQTGAVSSDVTGLTGTTTAGSAVVTALGSTANLVVGMVVNMTGVPAGRTIASIDSGTQITLNSGTSVTAGTNSAAFGYGSRTLTLTGTNTGTNTIAGVLQNSTAGSGVLSVTKNGAGTWVLSGTNTYTGATNVNAGTLRVNGQLASGSVVTVLAGATLGGNGTVGGPLTVNGSIAPGNSIDLLTVANDVTWNGVASSEWIFELGASNTADLLDITGGTSDFLKGTGIGGTDFVFNFAGSTDQGTFDLVSWDGTTTFAASDFSYQNLGGGNTGTFQISGGSTLQFVVVPEPTTLALLGTGAALLGLRLARRRKA